MSMYGLGIPGGGHGFSLKALLEDPNLQNPPNLNSGLPDLKKPGTKHGGYVANANAAFLRPNLWEKPSEDNNGDFDLEYMDLDEFLSENGIPVNPDENDDAQTISLLASALARTPPSSPNQVNIHQDVLIGPASPEISGLPSPRDPDTTRDSKLGLYMPESPVRQTVSPLNLSPCASPSGPSEIEKRLMDDNYGVSPATDKKPVTVKIPEINFKVNSQDLSLATIPVYHEPIHRACTSSVASVSSPRSPVFDTFHTHDNDSRSSDDNEMTHNIVPGQENFDPKSRKFTDEELKPQPIIKKSRKVFVDDSAKDDKYWSRRKKNNVAAKRSRDARRVKENQIAMRAAFLETENDTLRIELEKCQQENQRLIKRLSKYERVDKKELDDV